LFREYAKYGSGFIEMEREPLENSGTLVDHQRSAISTVEVLMIVHGLGTRGHQKAES
jgi:hypothetical protein